MFGSLKVPKFKFFPEDWTPDQKILDWAKAKGVSEKQVMEQLEEIKLHEFQPMRSCARRTFQKWINNGIRWGHIVPSVTPQYRKPEDLSDTERERDKQLFEEQMKKFGVEV